MRKEKVSLYKTESFFVLSVFCMDLDCEKKLVLIMTVYYNIMMITCHKYALTGTYNKICHGMWYQ